MHRIRPKLEVLKVYAVPVQWRRPPLHVLAPIAKHQDK